MIFSTSLLTVFALALPASAQHIRQTGTHRRALRARNATESKRQYPSFAITDRFAGSNFFDEWDFFTGSDPTHGYVNYVDSGTAWNAGLVSTSSSSATIKVDDYTWLAQGQPRNSVRISSQNSYSGGLFILDIDAMPYGCGLWPAWWTVGPNWPNAGEIDIIEAVNGATTNQMTLHTDPGCTQSSTEAISGLVLSTDCDANIDSNSGCGITDPDTTSSGAGLAQAGGGVFAMLWDGSGVQIWHFARANVPDDINNGNPTPGDWGEPKAQWSSGTCNPDEYLVSHSIVFDTTICGDWAGSAYASAGCPGTCETQVMDPNNFQTASWEINYVAVYHETS